MSKTIYCDGACWPNPGQMGIGVFVPYQHKPDFKMSRFLGQGTNQKAELIALTRAIEISQDGDIIYTDSKYALGMSGTWKAKCNIEETLNLRNALKNKRVSLRWVKGHNGNIAQEIADSLAEEAVRRGKRAEIGIDQPCHPEENKASLVPGRALEPAPVAVEIPSLSECEPEAWGCLCW